MYLLNKYTKSKNYKNVNNFIQILYIMFLIIIFYKKTEKVKKKEYIKIIFDISLKMYARNLLLLSL